MTREGTLDYRYTARDAFSRRPFMPHDAAEARTAARANDMERSGDLTANIRLRYN